MQLHRGFLCFLEAWKPRILKIWNLGVWNSGFQTPRFQDSQILGFQASN